MGLSQISMMELIYEKVNGFQPLTIFSKDSIIDVWQGFKYTFGMSQHSQFKKNIKQSELIFLIYSFKMLEINRKILHFFFAFIFGSIPFQYALVICLYFLILDEFFTWTNSPACHKCGSQTKAVGNDAPYPSEMMWDAGVVECYQCVACSENVRFPRYNHPQKLLGTVVV